MTRFPILSALAVFAITAAAEAAPRAPASLDAAFSNTILSTYPDGRTAHLWLNPDGSYKAMGRRKDRSDGHWSMKGEKLCLKQSHPMAVPFTFCAPVRTGGVGTTWTSKAVTGEKSVVKIVAGRAGA
jgi:hypothetical protein